MGFNVARLSIKRPIFIACIVILMAVVGVIGYNRLGVDLFPPMDYPAITVSTVYPGTTPDEIEKLISKPLEEQISTISGLNRLSSYNKEGISTIVAEFTYETEARYALERVKEKVSLARNNLPDDLTTEPLVQQFDFTNMPIVTLALVSDLPPTEIYDLGKERIKSLLEQVPGVGEVKISGGTRREIQVELDRNKLNAYEISAITVANQLGNAGANIPVGKFSQNGKSTSFRTIGEFNNIDQIKKTVISFSGDVSNSVNLQTIGTVKDTAEDQKTISYFYYPVNKEIDSKTGVFLNKTTDNGKVRREMRTCILLDVYKQSGANSVEVSDGVKGRLGAVNEILKASKGNPKLISVYDSSNYIRNYIDDVEETMVIGILLAVIVVYLFLGNVRSTIITGLAIPNSLLGAFVIMYFTGFTINLMTLIALSLTIGLLVDDAIVVRENIFRKLERGMHPLQAAEHGTKEVMLPVIATTLTIISVFLPIAFIQGIVGRFFKQFGLTVVFAMCISLFDALVVAPLLSAYFAGSGHKAKNLIVRKFDQFQDWMDKVYLKVVSFCLARPIIVILITTVVFLGSIFVFVNVKKTFEPESDESQFLVNMELPPGTSLNGTSGTMMKIVENIKKIPELDYMTIQAGTSQNEDNKASLGVFMLPAGERERSMNEIKESVRSMLKEFAYAKPSVDEYSRSSASSASKAYVLYLKGEDVDALTEYADKLMKRLEKIPDLIDMTTSAVPGNPEFQIQLDEQKMQMFGVTQKMAGLELRYHVEGNVVGKLRDRGLEYDIRMRLKPEQRDLQATYKETRVPNMSFKMIPLTAIASFKNKTGPSMITRQDRQRIVAINANIGPGGALGSAITQTENIISKELPLPKNITYKFVGMTDVYQDMMTNMIIAFVLALLFIYLVLASLYESFITPATILMALPPAISGAIYALFLTGKMVDMFSMIGMIMLLGLVAKNSILLVDFALEGVRSGMSRKEAIINAGKIRLRPILMTTFAMLAGMLPVALGVGAAASYRSAMGVAIIGGLVVSTMLTLLLVPALFEYVDKIREAVESKFRPTGSKEVLAEYFEESEMSEDLKKLLEDKTADICVTVNKEANKKASSRKRKKDN